MATKNLHNGGTRTQEICKSIRDARDGRHQQKN